MSLKFHGSLQELKERLAPLALVGQWEAKPNGVHKFCHRDKAGMHWSETKGTVWFDGPDHARAALAARIETALADGAVASAPDKGSTIFVVHGRDTDARDQRS